MNRKAVSVHVFTHGCKLNQYEGEALIGSFERSGFRIRLGQENAPPDVTVVNTCTVTGKSDRKSRNTIRRAAHEKKPGSLLIVTGCYAQTDADTLRKLEGVDYVFGNVDKAFIPAFVRSLLGEGSREDGVEKARKFAPLSSGEGTFEYEDPPPTLRSRVYVKIQDGCSVRCAYCKVPMARGESRSRDYGHVVEHVSRLVDSGCAEVVLTGVNLGDYRFEGKRLFDLLARLVSLPGDFRIRLSSVEPMNFSRNLLDVIGYGKIAPHFHIPLQSGSDRILGSMGRPYRTEDYFALVEEIRSRKPESHIATDVIVGFPGESEDDFLKSVEAVSGVRFSSMHVFKYSPRAGTRAALLTDDVPYPEKEKRSARLVAMRDRLNYLYRKQFLGSVREAVFEREKGGSVCRGVECRSMTSAELFGITDNYIRVRVVAVGHTARMRSSAVTHIASDIEGKKLPLRIVDVTPRYTSGEVIL